jgi:hypothetical protein
MTCTTVSRHARTRCHVRFTALRGQPTFAPLRRAAGLYKAKPWTAGFGLPSPARIRVMHD